MAAVSTGLREARPHGGARQLQLRARRSQPGKRQGRSRGARAPGPTGVGVGGQTRGGWTWAHGRVIRGADAEKQPFQCSPGSLTAKITSNLGNYCQSPLQRGRTNLSATKHVGEWRHPFGPAFRSLRHVTLK